MNILVVGSTGSQGREFVAQALGAGHGVRALARDPSALQPAPSLEVVRGDVFDPPTLDVWFDRQELGISSAALRYGKRLLRRAERSINSGVA